MRTITYARTYNDLSNRYVARNIITLRELIFCENLFSRMIFFDISWEQIVANEVI